MNINCPECDNRVGNYEFIGVNQERLCPTCKVPLIARKFEKPKDNNLYKILFLISGLVALSSSFYFNTYTYIGLWSIASLISNHFYNKKIMKAWRKWKLNNEKNI